MVIGFLRFVLFAIAAYVAFLFLRIFLGLKRPGSQSRPGAPGQIRGMMVKDDVCGTYIPHEDALTDVRDGVERYYCSEECRRKAAGR
jgi:YHS domain-containing protein